jgi:hypothetical protein
MTRNGWCLILAGAVSVWGAPPDYARDVQPVLARNCLVCHGGQQQMAGLRLDQPLEKTRAAKVLAMVEGKKMPPAGKGLSAAEVSVLREWVQGGAPFGKAAGRHWAFTRIERPAVPAVKERGWARNAVDAFVLAEMEKVGVRPAEAASEPVLARRMAFDLTGLPPEGRTADAAGLLASPHFGERWARPWLDLAHYGDSDGYEQDTPRRHAWRYRDWVIGALNRNMRFDQFTREQLAGDLFRTPSQEQLTAAGFLRQTLTSREGGIDIQWLRAEQLAERVSLVGTVWLGLTFNCTRCHDHKYDPLRQKEFYQLGAFFESSEEQDLAAPVGNEVEAYRKVQPEYLRKRDAILAKHRVHEVLPHLEKKLLAYDRAPDDQSPWRFVHQYFQVWVPNALRILRKPGAERTFAEQHWMVRFLAKNRPQNLFDELGMKGVTLAGLLQELDDLDEAYPTPSEIPTMKEVAQYPASYVHVRGDYLQKGETVEPVTPAFLPGLRKTGRATRMDLADWLVSRENPLVARVAVNRMWQELFGRGLVETSEDLGIRGERPTHPELLDWLAVEFIESGWDVKHMVRLMVESNTYGQSTVGRPEALEKDAENRLWSRQTRLRLPAELIRDNALAVSGMLNRTIGGPSVRPPLPEGVSKLAFRFRWKVSESEQWHRRGLYVHWQRSVPFPQFTTFDMPDLLTSCTRRPRSVSPLQALTLLNDPVFVEAAAALGRRIEGQPDGERVEFAFRVALQRRPTAAEKARVQAFVEARPRGAWQQVASALMNLDEFQTRE